MVRVGGAVDGLGDLVVRDGGAGADRDQALEQTFEGDDGLDRHVGPGPEGAGEAGDLGLKKPWDMGGIAAALHGVARQASQYFGCSSLDRVAITFGNMQFFVQAIGSVEIGDGRPARELLLVILADEKVKMGVVLVQMRKVAPRIVEAIKASRQDMALLKLDERAVREYLAGLKLTA